MRLELILVDGKPMGYNLVAEDQADQTLLKEVQNLHFLASNKQEKIEYGGVTIDQKAEVSRVMFMQRKFAVLPDNHITKKEIHKAILKKGVPV